MERQTIDVVAPDRGKGASGFFGPPSHGLRLWYAEVAGILWWTAHINAVASLVPLACAHPRVLLVMHAVTVVTALGTMLALWWDWALFKAGEHAADDRPSLAGRQHFLGLFGMAINGISLVVILWEGSYAFLIDPCL